MIYETGVCRPTRRQVQLIRSCADDSFCQTAPADFGDVPLPSGYAFEPRELTALSLKNVEPHNDPWVGALRQGDGIDGPEGRRALFWLLSDPKVPLYLQVGTMSHTLYRGGWVLFDDRILHGVYCSRKWFGLSYQLRPKIGDVLGDLLTPAQVRAQVDSLLLEAH